MSFAERTAELFRGQVTVTDGAAHLVAEFDDAWRTVRVREHPVLEVSVPCEAPLGFAMELGRRRWFSRGAVRTEASFDRHYTVATSEPALAALWLDEPARAAFLATERVDRTLALGDVFDAMFGRGAQWSGERRRACALSLRAGTVHVSRNAPEHDFARFLAALRAAVTVAARPRRLADEWRAIASSFGGVTVGDDWTTTDDFAVRLLVQGVEVTIDFRLDTAGTTGAALRLHTRLRGRRIARSTSPWLVWRWTLPRDRRPAAPALGRLALRGAAAAFTGVATDPSVAAAQLAPVASLLSSAKPDSVNSGPDEVLAVVDGVAGGVRLAAAVELVARLAVQRVAAPYR